MTPAVGTKVRLPSGTFGTVTHQSPLSPAFTVRPDGFRTEYWFQPKDVRVVEEQGKLL